jgi:hypothetical protein
MATIQTPNTARFMPGRKDADGNTGQIMFTGMRYSRSAVETPTGFVAGIGFGPGQHIPKGDNETGPGFVLSPGGVIVPARPNDKLQPIPVRDFQIKGEKKPRQYIDFATFKQIGNELFAVPLEEDNTCYWEIWTGDFQLQESTYQLIQAGVFNHGSVAYSGGKVVVDAPSKKRGKRPQNENATGSMDSSAELIAESMGEMVGGVPFWHARTWRCKFTPKESETLLVRQLNTFYLLECSGGKFAYHEMPAVAVEQDFQTLLLAA